jgi:hypothetical protein
MADMIELSDLDFNNDNFGGGWDKKSTNFGGGLELLMNDKIKENSRPSSDIDLEDLNNLENELNDLVEDIPINSFKPKSDFFGSPNSSFDDRPSVRFDKNPIGEFTAKTETDNKTWDGYGKFNNIPMNPDKSVPMEPKLSKEDIIALMLVDIDDIKKGYLTKIELNHYVIIANQINFIERKYNQIDF